MGMRELFRKASAGQLPSFARIISKSAEPSSMQIGEIVVVQSGVERVLLEEMLTMSVNSVDGDKAQESITCLSLPSDASTGSISTYGNATVSNGDSLPTPKLAGGAKELKVSSPSGAFAVVRIRQQRDTELKYFDIIFGTKGQMESVDEEGRKSRSHIALHPDGNGKFLRLIGAGCEMTSEQDYSAATRSISPRHIKICAPQFPETLVAKFTSTGVIVELVSIAFESPTSGNV